MLNSTLSTIGHIMAALSQSLFFSFALAILLYPHFHGNLEYTKTGSSYWNEYFIIGGFRVDHLMMFAIFIIVFVIFPAAFGRWLARRSKLPRFHTHTSFFGFSLLIGLALGFNALVALVYSLTNLEW